MIIIRLIDGPFFVGRSSYIRRPHGRTLVNRVWIQYLVWRDRTTVHKNPRTLPIRPLNLLHPSGQRRA